MKIIVIDSRRHGVENIALPFEEESDIVDAWDWVVANDWLSDFSYRPAAEGEDPNRFFIEKYLADIKAGTSRLPLAAGLVRKLFASIYGAELQHQIIDLYDPKPALKIARGK